MPKLISISEEVWRTAASNHKCRIQSLLRPGLVQKSRAISYDNVQNQPGGKRVPKENRLLDLASATAVMMGDDVWGSSLDPVNPVYNFLIEYYGIKGSKGIRRLSRWSPDPSLLLLDVDSEDDHVSNEGITLYGEDQTNTDVSLLHSTIYQAAMQVSHGLGGILLENANVHDLGGTLHLRGCIPVPVCATSEHSDLYGILYNPAIYYNHRAPNTHDASHINSNHITPHEQTSTTTNKKTISQFQWYASILQSTLNSEPILHCHGLHEWAMQYRPPGAPPPPSAKYQANLPLRVSQQVINEAVERKGISCTHVDALRFFAPDAKPLNHPGGSELERKDQLRLEQKACVHAHMDLLKIALKLTPFVDADLLGDVLEVALEARKLDVEASPYDATAFGVGIVPVETKEGRKLYRERQRDLMERVEPVRKRLLKAYESFLLLAFGIGM